MKHLLSISLSALITIAGVGLAPAQAAKSDCNSSNVCMWSNANYSGTRKWIGNLPGYRNFDVAFNDVASSWANQSVFYDAEWYYDANLQGNSGCMPAQASTNDMGWRDNDEASSAIIYTTIDVC